MSSEALAVIGQGAAQSLMPVLSVELAVERHKSLVKFVKTLMNEGSDFGKIPNTDKPTLLKPGAEKLTTFFGLSKRFHLTEKIEDWSGANHGGEPFFYYLYRCSLYNGDTLIAEADGSCNSFEKKYRWRKGERRCPACGEAAIIKSKYDSGGWYCFPNKGGCGGKFPEGAAEIENQEVGRVANPDVCDQVNTIQKMAQKRAFIAATLLAVNASEFFTQDVEDLVEEPNGAARPVAPEARKPASNGPARSATQSNGKSAEEQELDKTLFAYCVKEKGDKNAPAFFKARYESKSLDEKRALVKSLGISAEVAAVAPPVQKWKQGVEADVVDAELVESEPEPTVTPARAEIGEITDKLQNLGCGADHINAKIAKLTGGVYALDEIDEADLAKIKMMLSNYA